METAPVLDPIESRSIGQDETLRFQRLERVRARQRTRRRQRLILVTALVTAVAGIGILGLTKRHTVSTTVGKPVPSPTSGIVPAATGDGELKRDAAPPPPRPAVAPAPAPHSPAPPAGRSGGAAVSPRAAPRETEAVDSTAAIDWLLKTPRTGSR
jgi:hypothetical protein